jgi:hypothetical protein
VVDNDDADLRVPEGVAGWLVVGAVVALITRPILWIMSNGTLGAILGGVEILLARADVSLRVLIPVEAGLLAAGVVAGLVAAFVVRSGEERAIRFAELLGWVYAVAAGWYLASLVLWVILVGPSVGALVFLVFPLAVNAYLLILARRIVRACRAVRPEPDPAGATP